MPSGSRAVHNEFSQHLQCQPPIWVLVQVLVNPPPIQLPANAPRKVPEDGLNPWALPTKGGDPKRGGGQLKY